MNVEVHILAFNEAQIIAYALRHYSTFAQRIVIHDGGSDDGTQDIAAKYGAEVIPWNTGGRLNDELAMKLKNECWHGTDADWVICVDADEFIYFPAGSKETLAVYDKRGAAVIKPHGFEMFSEEYPTTAGQIYEQCAMGAPDNVWYSKPVLFSPKRVDDSGFGVGAHESTPLLKNGMRVNIGASWPKPSPRTFLLHYHQLGPIERVAARYDATRLRLSAINERNRWGNFEPGLVHAQRKRALILPHLQRVIPSE